MLEQQVNDLDNRINVLRSASHVRPLTPAESNNFIDMVAERCMKNSQVVGLRESK